MAEDKNSYRPTKGEENPWVMYLIVRSSLNMSTGKTAAQVGHAVGMVYEKYEEDLSDFEDACSEYTSSEFNSEQLDQIKSRIDSFVAWKTTGHRKIVLKASDKEFEKIKQELENLCIVCDAGLTEILAGETVISLHPLQKSNCPKIIKRLQCL